MKMLHHVDLLGVIKQDAMFYKVMINLPNSKKNLAWPAKPAAKSAFSSNIPDSDPAVPRVILTVSLMRKACVRSNSLFGKGKHVGHFKIDSLVGFQWDFINNPAQGVL